MIDYDIPSEQMTQQDIEMANDLQNTMSNMIQPYNSAEMPQPTNVQTGGQALAQ